MRSRKEVNWEKIMDFERSGGDAVRKERSFDTKVLIFEEDLRLRRRRRMVCSTDWMAAEGAQGEDGSVMPAVGVGSVEGGSRMTSKRSRSLMGARQATQRGILSRLF